MEFGDFPVNAASNSISPLCLKNFTFQPNLTEEEMLYHNLVIHISELIELKVKIASLISQIQEIEQLDKLETVGKETAEEDSARLLGVINAITEKSDISLANLIEETNKDKELSTLRQAVIDGELEHVSTHYRHRKNQLSVEFGLVFLNEMVLIPDRMQEWMLQVAHGDHESADKMREICQRVNWETKKQDIAAKVNNCLTCFRSGKKLKTILPKTEKKRASQM